MVSNTDSVRTYRELVGGVPPPASRAAGSTSRPAPAWCSTSASTAPTTTCCTTTSSSPATPRRSSTAIYHRGEPAPDPTCYLAAPARTEPGVAPPGGEALYVLVHTPYLRPHHDWTPMLPAYRRVILDKLARTAGLHDLERRIVVERALTPQDIHDRYRVLNGAIYGLAATAGCWAPSSRATAAATSTGCTSPAARRTPGRACRWC